jgi:PAS domain S-box-containing protein
VTAEKAPHVTVERDVSPPGVVHPAAIEREIAADELFFSTTDRRGIITSGNSVFSRISGYAMGELIGSPHNLVRHPGMPGGVFRIVWDRLLSGRLTAAYVANRTKAGDTYWVFATITPLGDGFLSVRVAPRGPLFARIRSLYAEVRAYEDEARRHGASRADAAALGAAELTRRLARLGFADVDQLIAETLPAEMASRGRLIGEHFARPGARGPAAGVLTATAALDDSLCDLTRRLDRYGALAASLAETSGVALAAAEELRGALVAAIGAGERTAGTAPVLGSVARVMGGLGERCVVALESLVRDLRATRDLVSGLTVDVSLAGLHNDMAAAFGAEIVDGAAPAGVLPDIAKLCDALVASVQDLAVSLPDVNARLARVAGQVDAAAALFAEVRLFTGKWRGLVYRHHQENALAELAEPIDRHLDGGYDQLAELSRLAAACRAEIVPFDAVRLEAPLSRIEAAARPG